MSDRSESRVGNLSWPRLAALATTRIGLLPVGAASKEHGRHLPLATDLIQAEWLAGEVAARLPALIWPAVHYGCYPAFADYPGSPSLDPETFENTLCRVLVAMHRSGHHRCVVLNSGISTIASVERACAGDPSRQAVHVYAGPAWQRAASTISRQQNGGHADQLETSVMLHLRPEMVAIEEARDESATRFGPGPLNRGNPLGSNYSPTGAMGNPTLADAASGHALCRAMLADALRALRVPARAARPG
jgi:creatinine amidohydrolase